MRVWTAITSEGTRLKREQLSAEISLIPDEQLRANLRHTMSKLFMFLEDDLEAALRIAARNPYTTGDAA